MAELGDFQRGIERIADQLIREAQEKGAFHDLPGTGKPIPGIDQPVDDFWWLRRWVKREQLQEPRLRRELRSAQDAKVAERGTGSPP